MTNTRINPDRPAIPTDLYLGALHRHVEALDAEFPGRDERARAHVKWSHWYAVGRLARAAALEIVERELERLQADGRTP